MAPHQMNVAIFGSAFDPPTLGHADAVQFLLETKKFDQVWLVPSFRHAFAKICWLMTQE